MLHFLGIRHHGPGSARSVERYLKAHKPDCILVEMPQEADTYLPYLANPKMKPPVALLIYNKKDPRTANYYPFTAFSPEYIAIRWAQKNAVTVRSFDLPTGWIVDKDEEIIPKTKIARDPLGFMAELAGYEDRERWWDVIVEQTQTDDNLFPHIADLMGKLRAESGPPDRETATREAYMREQIRKALKMGFENIAIVCGAWHVPPLEDHKAIPAKEDKALLKEVTKTKVLGTWVPWSYNLLERSTYAAGIESPQWYEHLFQNRDQATSKWMTRAARLLRKHGYPISSAHAIEAVRLAETLTSVREQTFPGIDILEEALIAILGQGSEKALALIKKHLVVGDVLGKVPPELPTPPLQQDLEKQIKEARLSREWKTTDPITKDLDLRKDNHQKASILLHRLDLLDIPWGKKKQKTGRELGSFKESWRLHRKVGHVLELYAKSSYGSTIIQAVDQFTRSRIANNLTLPQLLEVLEKTLLSDLPSLLSFLFQQLQQQAADTTDLQQLVNSVAPLVFGIEFGTARNLSVRVQQATLEQILPRIWVGLPNALIRLDEDNAKIWKGNLQQLHHALLLWNDEEAIKDWEKTLLLIVGNENTSPLIQGYLTRVATDRAWMTVNQASKALQFRLSPTTSVEQGMDWLLGFLSGNGMLLIWQPQLLNIIHDWISKLSASLFKRVLPLLRKAFSAYPDNVKAQIAQVLFRKEEKGTDTYENLVWEQESWDDLKPTLTKWLE